MSSQICTFRIENLSFGIEITRIQEVILAQTMTPVPLASSVISGLINLRGQIVTALDVRRHLGFEPRSEHEDLPMNVVVRWKETCVSFLVDSIGDVIDVSEDMFEPPPSTLDARHRELIDAVCKLDDELLLLLDPDTMIAAVAR